MNYYATVENGTGIVRGVASGEGEGPEPEFGFTTRPILKEAHDQFIAWLKTNDETDRPILDIDLGTISFEPLLSIPATINKTVMLSDGVDAILISGLPNPTRVILEGIGFYIVTDGTFEFSYDTPAVFHVVCESEGYLPASFVITVQ